ncbi:MAG: peptidase M56 BlaR1, partial [Clostridia bacterium]|nr:peptidase M56 BlaR1 [Clostridia bacterium]
MSLTASIVILAVIAARFCLRRAPKKISYWLWLAVAFRLCCPVSWNSPFSLFSVVPVQTRAEQA